MGVIMTPESLINPASFRGKRGAALRRYKHLEDDRSSWRSHWLEISDNLLPRRGIYLLESQNSKGRKRNGKIVDATGTMALRTMAAGMMSGMTSPSRPWFRFGTEDPDMMESHAVKKWLAHAEGVVRGVLQKSNFYNSMYSIYEELGAFGTAPLYRQRSVDSVIRFRPFTAGEYVVAENDLGVIDTVGRHFTMTVAQIYKKFVLDPFTGKEDWTGVSKATKKLWEDKNFDALIQIIHMIQPREMYNPNKLGQLNKPFVSMYFEYGGDSEELLFEGGYDQMPVYVPRWDVRPGDVYGRCPGMDFLGDVKQLQHEQKKKAQAIDKMVDPPMVASTQLRGKPTSLLPAGVTFIDPMQGGQGFSPAYQVQPRVNELMMDIQEVQNRIMKGFYADLFAMMLSSDRRQMTATEVAERHEEKLILLGPVLQRVNVELLDPALQDTFAYATDAGLIEPPPQELQGGEYKIEYVSLLAQAQQAVSASGIERTLSFAGNLVGVFPDVVDVIDPDAAMRQYSGTVGNSPDIIRDPKVVEKLRAQRAEAQQQQQQMEMATQGAQAAKTLSETDSTNPNALTALLQGGG